MSSIDIGGSLQDLPYPKYKDFFAKFSEIDSISVDQWKPLHLVAYFCKLYKNQYQLDYKFKFNSSAPSKCYEIVQIKRMAQNLTSDPVKLKKYMDWAFVEKVKNSKKRITSIAFLSHEFMITEYKLKYLAGELREQQIDRTTQIPDNYLSIIKQFGYQINTYGDLSFLIQMSDAKINEMISTLKNEGLNFDLVRGIS